MVKQLSDNYIEDKLIQYYKKIKKNIRKQSIKVYVSNIRNIYKMLGHQYEYGNLNIFYGINGVIKTLEYNYKNINTLMTKVSSIIMWLRASNFRKEYIEKYTEKLFQMDKKKKIFTKTKIKTTKLKMDKNKLGDVKNKLEKSLKNENLKDIQNWLIYNLYSGEYIPPARIDFNKMKIVDEYKEGMSNKFNYYSKKNKKFIFLNYKTNKRGATIVDIPDELNEILLEVIPLISNKFLFVDRNDKPYSDNTFGKIVSAVFDGAGVSDMRKYYLSTKFDKLKKVLDELKEDTYKMMNSEQVALSHYISEFEK